MSITVWSHHHDGGFSGMSPVDHREFVRRIAIDGHAIVTDSRTERSWNHRIVGIGIGHDDAQFAEAGTSEAAWVENGEDLRGPWWEDTDRPYSVGRKYYGCTGSAVAR